MTGFFAFFGIIFLLLIIRYLWIRVAIPAINPSSPLRVNGQIILPDTPKYKSIERLCQSYNCRVDNLRYTVLSGLNISSLDASELNNLLLLLKKNKMEESLKMHILPEDTGYAFIEVWVMQELSEMV